MPWSGPDWAWTGILGCGTPTSRNYRRVVYLSQATDDRLVGAAVAAAERLGLAFEHHPTGRRHLAAALAGVGRVQVA